MRAYGRQDPSPVARQHLLEAQIGCLVAHQVLPAIAQHRSFRRAAEALVMSQPAVSRQLAALEAEVGVRLLVAKPLTDVPVRELRLIRAPRAHRTPAERDLETELRAAASSQAQAALR